MSATWGLYTRTIPGWSNVLDVFFNTQPGELYEIQRHTAASTVWTQHAVVHPIAGELQKHTLYGVGPGETFIRARALNAAHEPISAWSNSDSSVPDQSGKPQTPPTSLIDKLRKSYAAATPGRWVATDTLTSGSLEVADFGNHADARFIETSKECMDAMLLLYDTAKAIHARTVLGFTYLRASERKALDSIMRLLG